MRKLIGTLICAICAQQVAIGGNSHGAHTHGLANLTIAAENNVLELEFESPAVNLLGFEHKPSNKAQTDAVDKAKKLLGAAENIVTIVGTDCAAESGKIEILGPAGADLKREHEHDDDHSHSSDDHNDHDHDVHSEITAVYQFNCTDSEKLESVTVNLFQHFSGLEKIQAHWVTETKQGEVMLRLSDPVIELR